jgi:hypothetical protein
MSPIKQRLLLSLLMVRFDWSIADDRCCTDESGDAAQRRFYSATGMLPFSGIAGRKSH